MSIIMDGKALASTIKENVAKWIKRDLNHTPTLAILTFGDDDASKVYVKNKLKAAEEVGIRAHHCIISEEVYNQPNFKVDLIDTINAHDGVILQLPVPYWCNAKEILEMIPAEKDVDGLTAKQVGLLRTAPLEALSPCTPAGIMELILEYYHPFDKEDGYNNTLVIGRSNLVGRPIAEMLLQDDWTVTIAHSRTPKEELLRAFANADLVISAAGKRNLITEEDAFQFWKDNRHYFPNSFKFKQKRVIIDVSINRDENGKLCGDFSEEFKQKYSECYTPVPGGVGPMTVAMLMYNTYVAAREKEKRYNVKELIKNNVI